MRVGNLTKKKQNFMAKNEKGNSAHWKRILETLAAAGVVKIVIEYSGSGDSGAIDEVNFFDQAEMEIDSEAAGLVEEDNNFIEDQVYTILEDYSDWYNNDGGQGTLTVDVSTGKFDCHHGSNYTETNWEDHEGSVV
jgi:hypothetical protein